MNNHPHDCIMTRPITFLLAALMCASAVAQDSDAAPSQIEVQFALLPAQNSQLPDNVLEILNTKTMQILTRNSANAANSAGVFAMVPNLTVGDIKTADGLVKSVSLATGEFVLAAVNRVDGTVYNSVTVPLKCEITGDADAALLALAKSIKPTDAAYTRFIRNTRKRIAEQVKEAPVAPLAPEVPEAPVAPDVTQQPIPKDENPQGAAPVKDTPCDIYISNPDLKFKVLSCKGSSQNRRITINTVMENTTMRNWTSEQTKIAQAVSDNGYDIPDVDSDYKYIDLPAEVMVRRDFAIKNVGPSIGMLSYVKLYVGNTVVELRNLPVVWD